jgi:hypothetical protein
MEQSPDSHSASQEIPPILWNPKVHQLVHKSPPPVPDLSQLTSVHTVQHFPKIRFNIILLFPSGLFPSDF